MHGLYIAGSKISISGEGRKISSIITRFFLAKSEESRVRRLPTSAMPFSPNSKK